METLGPLVYLILSHPAPCVGRARSFGAEKCLEKQVGPLARDVGGPPGERARARVGARAGMQLRPLVSGHGHSTG